MDTREKIEYGFWVIALNDMRGAAEDLRGIAAFSERADALAFYHSCVVEPWTDEPSADNYGNVHEFNKVYRKGSPLEWCNPPNCDFIEKIQDGFGAGIFQHWQEDGSTDQRDWSIPINPQPYVAL